MYTNGEEKREYEVCFDVAGSSDVIKHDVAEFKSHVKSWITIYTSEQFMRALYDLFEKDPWMNMTS